MKALRFFAGAVTVSLVAALALLPGCGRQPDPWDSVPGQPRVLTSFAPLYCFTLNVVGKEPVAVMSLLTTTGPHDYRPVAQDNLKAARCDIYFANGLTLDDWVAGLLESAKNTKVTKVALAEAVPEKDRLAFVCNHPHTPGHKHDHGEHDPHTWLGIPEAKLMVEKIRDTLSAADPTRKAAFEANAKAYLAELDQLLDEGKKAFAGKKNRALATMHDSLGYFARTFDLKIAGFVQPQVGIEAGNKHLGDLLELCKKEGVAVVTYEPQFKKTAAEQLEQALRKGGQQVRLIQFDTLETTDLADLNKDFYVRKMRENIKNLAEALP